MWRLFIILILLVASVWFGLEVVRHPGYLLIVYQPWMVQMPLWFALVSIIVFLGIFYLIISSFDRMQFFWFRLKNWLRLRREHQLYSKTQQGFSNLIEGRWKKAEHLLLTGVDQTAEPLINYLGAAKAAHEQKAFDRRDHYIQKAYQAAPNADLAIGLTKAELELSQDQLEQAAATLMHLRQTDPRHPGVLKLLEKVYVRLADWKNLEALLPSLRKAKMLNADELWHFEKNIYCERLNAASQKNLDELHAIWDSVPRHVKKHPDVVYAYVKQLLRFSDAKEAEDLIRKTLKHYWQPQLVEIYGALPFDNVNRQLVVVGAWLKMYGASQEVYLTLGRLCVKAQLYGKAKDYFEKCLSLGSNPKASLEYGELLEKLGQQEEAMQKFRQGLERL